MYIFKFHDPYQVRSNFRQNCILVVVVVVVVVVYSACV